MPNCFGYTCPQCDSGDSIDIEATVSVRLTPDGTNADASRNGDHEWNDTSLASCGCGWTGEVCQLNSDDEEEDIDDEPTGVCRTCCTEYFCHEVTCETCNTDIIQVWNPNA